MRSLNLNSRSIHVNPVYIVMIYAHIEKSGWRKKIQFASNIKVKSANEGTCEVKLTKILKITRHCFFNKLFLKHIYFLIHDHPCLARFFCGIYCPYTGFMR